MNKTKKDLGNVRHDFAASPERGSGKANHVADVGGLLGKIYEMAKEIKKETAKLCNMSYCEDCTLYQNDIPAHKIGKLWKFKKTELVDWVKSGESAL